MKIAYLIPAYRNPKLLKRTIDALSWENSAFFIHVDRKSTVNGFSSIKGDNVTFTDQRVAVYWAEYSMVQAIIILMSQAMAASGQFDYYVLLSGSEYPLRSKEYIHDFFSRNYGKEFISMARMPHERKPISRINTFRLPLTMPVRRTAVKALARLGLAHRDYRKHLGTMEPFAGNTWWALSREACTYILDFVRSGATVCKFFENTFVPDEMLLHTILGNSLFRTRVCRNVMFEDWRWCMQDVQYERQKKSYGLLDRSCHKSAHPAWLTEEHVRFFEESDNVVMNDIYGSGEALFARKFSDDALDLITRIDTIVRRKERIP